MTEKAPERRLLEAIVTLNAINHGRPIPDMEKIKGGFVLPLGPDQSREEIKTRLREALETAGITVKKSKPKNGTDITSKRN